MYNKKKFIKKFIGLSASVVLSMSSMLISGCASKEEAPLIIVENSNDAVVYNFVNCTYDDVVLTTTVRCTYKKNSEQEVYFPVSGKIVDKVYVQQGDEVHKGDVLAELSTGALEQEIAALEYSIARNELRLSYIEEEELLKMQEIWLRYGTGENEWRDKELESLYESNDAQEQSLNDTLEFDRLKLAQLRTELSQSRVYASIDGTVYSMTDDLEGSTSNIDEVVMTLVDNSEGYFETSAGDLVQYFNEGEPVAMNITVGAGKGDYELLPDDMANWGDTQRFVMYSGDTAEIEAGTNANIVVVMDSRKNVLTLPVTCVHVADGEYYVYVVNEDGMREVKWIEVGLIGNSLVEIKSGLSDGEKVIKR